MTKKTVKMTQRVSIQDILKKKQVLSETVNKPYFSEFFGGEIEIENHSPEKVVEILNSEVGKTWRGDLELIYAFCPIFRSKELQKQLEIEDPIDTVKEAFGNNVLEISALAKHIIRKYGLDVDKVEQIKKQ